MHKLARHVRFSITPFLADERRGYNSYASEPPGEGLSIFFDLCVELAGPVDAGTGFVVNVLDIDEKVREFVVPIFAASIKEDFRRGRHTPLAAIAELLRLAWARLAGRFGPAKVNRLSLALNPYRKITVESEVSKMLYYSEKFEFAAMHRLWNESFSDEHNRQVFGKCANPAGHGHNYVVEVTVKIPGSETGLRMGDFEKIVDDEFIGLVDHKNLNVDVAELRKINPTVENIATLAWEKLVGKFGESALHCVTVWETGKTHCSYSGA
jgi:6-pyruvoyltetrahydropterin/6-carboxytetrahydropterin synthase